MYLTINNTILAAFLIAAVAADLRTRKIPNALTVSAIAAALALNTYWAGTQGLWLALTGCGAGVALLLIPFAKGGIGGGDVKMLAVVGALKGPHFVFAAFLLAALAGGVIALAALLLNKNRKQSLQEYKGNIISMLSGSKPSETTGTTAESSRAIPYACAIAAGTAAALILPLNAAGWWG